MLFWDVLITVCFVVFPIAFDGTSDLGKQIFPILVIAAIPVLACLEPFPNDVQPSKESDELTQMTQPVTA